MLHQKFTYTASVSTSFSLSVYFSLHYSLPFSFFWYSRTLKKRGQFNTQVTRDLGIDNNKTRTRN